MFSLRFRENMFSTGSELQYVRNLGELGILLFQRACKIRLTIIV